MARESDHRTNASGIDLTEQIWTAGLKSQRQQTEATGLEAD